MAKICERKLFLTAWQYCEEHHPDELEWAKSVNKDTFKNIKPEELLRNYFWVLCNGHKLGVFDQIFLILASDMKNHDIAQVIITQFREVIRYLMYRKPVSYYGLSLGLNIYKDLDKGLNQITQNFLEGSKMIFDEGFETYKKQLMNSGGIKALEELPGIDSIKSSRLAKNIGLVDTGWGPGRRWYGEKPDIWLERAALECREISIGGILDGFSGRDMNILIGKDSCMFGLVEYLSEEFDCSFHVVDFVFWRYGKRALSMYDYVSVDKANDEKLFFTALDYCERYRQEQLEWVKSVNEDTFKNMESKEFLRNYCWIIFASDPELEDFEDLFAELQEAFKDFDITALSKMRSIKPALDAYYLDASYEAFDNIKQKAKCFLKGAKMIAKEGFETYKKRLKKEGIDALEALPDVDSSRLARYIGLTDTAEEEERVDYLSKAFNCSRRVVDFVLWRYEVDELEIDFAEDYEQLSQWWD